VNFGNYDDVLRQLREAGLLVDQLEIGRRVRCRVDGDREKRGWYHLHELITDAGGALIVGSFGVWRGNDNGAQKVQLAKASPLTQEQRQALKARIEADRRAADAARKTEAARAAERATRMWAKVSESGESEYLKRKGVANHGARFAPSGALVIPLLDTGGRIHGLQVIYPPGHPKRKRLGRDKDFWPAGLVKQGHFFMIGGTPAATGICLVAEGYATAASLYEASGFPVAVAFDAGNLQHVAAALRARYSRVRLLICGDDDYLGKCAACHELTLTGEATCRHCGEMHTRGNAGIAGASAAALAVGGGWLVPRFAAERPLDRKGPTDFNDLHLAEGLHVVRAQVEARLTALQWRTSSAAAPAHAAQGGGVGGDLCSISSLEELHERFALVYEASDTVFDSQEHKLVPLASMRNLCTSRQLHRWWIESSTKRVVRLEEVGFDPSERDASIKCNLWAGWPTRPKAGRCDKLLELGAYLCSDDVRGAELWRWLQRWLAYPIQHPGAKMKTAIIMHGPQGTGKNLFFEAVLGVYGTYGQVVDQDAVEDKYNDYLSRKLMLVADEVVARMEMFQAKNKLKTLVTSDWITINPKFVARYRERNHVNLVFLSNEVQPMALERDDRRYAVIWTPPKWEEAMYNAVLAEIRDGGVAALHDYLLQLDLGDFGPATLPPMTQAKEDLIELGMDSSERFYVEWTKGYTPLPAVTVRTEDLYDGYKHWCGRQGVMKPAQLSTFVGNVSKRPGVRKGRERHFLNHSQRIVQSMLIAPPGCELKASPQQLADGINQFNKALHDWKKPNGGEVDDQPF
jgi:putative DNA primase/helicase